MKRHNFFRLTGIIAGMLLVGAGCAPTTPTTNSSPSETPSAPSVTASADSTTVSISNFSFQPGDVAVKRGATVVWTNRDSVPHTVTVDQDSGPASSTLNPDDSYSYTFSATGQFNYHCNFHPSMRGSITVTE